MQALKSLRKGIQDYDRRRGWRGPITNKLINKNWKKIISQYKLDPTLNWQLVEIISLEKNEIKFKEGIASSFELRQAQNQLYSIQNEYLEATLKLIENKINLEILLNK